MSYDVFISYEISDSSLAYGLASVLSRNSMTYYLDCVNSSVALNDYVKKLFSDSKLFVPLVSARYLRESYARNLLSYAVGINKPILVCNTDEGCTLPAGVECCIPAKNRVDVRNSEIDSVVQNEVLRLLNQSEGEKYAELQETSIAIAEENVSIADSA